MKIIFLDIDGVLNHQMFFKNRIKSTIRKDYDKSMFDPECVERLNEITGKTGAVIVLSSTWRKSRTIEELKALFKKVGITGKLIDKTPVLNSYNQKTKTYPPRGCEIHEWINSNKDILGTNILNWKSYVIIDDDSDMLYWQRKNFFQTDGSGGGLTANLTYKIINFLK